MNRVSRSRAVDMIKGSKGRFFTATFKKRDGSSRTMNCNYKTGSVTNMGGIRVYSMQDKGYRTINPQTLSELVINNTTYRVR